MNRIENLNQLLPELIELRRHLHAHPELSGEEHQTAALVAGELRKYYKKYLPSKRINTGLYN